METAERAAAYIRVACTSMSFDIGEVWCTDDADVGTETYPSKSKMRFLQLYTAPSYDTARTKLLEPKEVPNENEVEQHKFSPMLCNAVNAGGEVIWATTDDEGSAPHLSVHGTTLSHLP